MSETPDHTDTPKAPRTGEDAAIAPDTAAPAATNETAPAMPDTAAGSETPPAPPATASGDGTPPPPPATPPTASGSPSDMKEAPLLEHLVELRTRLVRCLIAVGVGFAASYSFAERLLDILLHPLMEVMPAGSKLIATSLPETFFTVMKLAMVAGAFVASPYIFYQLWQFVAPGLYKEERKIIVPVAIASAFCFVSGALFGYFIVFPFGFKFFVDYASDYITVMPTISAYFSLAVTLLFAFGLIFELPVFIFFLTSLGMVSTKALRKFRRWAILLSFVVSAILTPTPDAINQLLMAGPMVVLYELGIWVSWFVDKPRLAEKAARKAAEEAAKNPPEPPKSPDTPGEPEAPDAEPAATATAGTAGDTGPKAG
ncbi:Twin-arginine translocation protein TatC [Desulfovibrio sp. DV]|uniref:twin-arginine translocase subunit TatC n=1 Tax=Desulfovibrio sp. DV TaxID=1844708 RepID=UPI00094B8516|nr:twin-arginine translocase subunit TatC [Desulfovibrio sp. DV]OLN26770.1 Twin-arginine translocation protein TatC [Desulfovibrio sp. DV]